MTETLERLTTEVRKLTPGEVEDLRAWLAEFRPVQSAQPAKPEKRVDWSGHFARVEKIFEGSAPVRENAVLALRREEHF